MSSKSRAQQTAAKRAREQRLKERRAMKDQKRRERKEAASEAAAGHGHATDAQRAPEGDAGGEPAATASGEGGDGQPIGPATTGSIMKAMGDE